MSNKVTITDFLIKLGFDSSEVREGVKSLKKEFDPLNKKLTQDAVKQTKQQKKKNNELKIENRLTAKRLALQKQIDTLKAKGDTKTARSLTGSLRGKNIDKLETARLRGVEAIRKVEAEISSSKIKAGKVADKELASRRKIKAEYQAYAEDVRRTDKANAANARANRQKKSREETITGRRLNFDRTLTNASRSLGDVNPVDDKQAEAIRALRKEYALLAQKGKLAKTANDFKRLGKEYDTLKDRTRKVTKATRAMRADMKKSEFAAKSMKDSMRNLARSYLSIYAVGASVVSVVRTGQELMSLKATLLGVSGTAQGAAEDFSFISAASRRLGVDLTEATSAYGKLGAAAKAAGLDNAQARNAFLASAELATAFNLSTSDFEGVSRAMSQILSKGKLSTEE